MSSIYTFPRLESEDVDELFRGSWDGETLSLTIPFLTIDAPETNGKELEQNLEAEMRKAVDRLGINEILSRLPWIPGDRQTGGILDEVKTDATTAAGVADVLIGEIRKRLIHLLGKRCTMPIEQLKADDPEEDWEISPWENPFAGPMRILYTNDASIPFEELPPVHIDRHGGRHVGLEAIQAAREAELAEIETEKNMASLMAEHDQLDDSGAYQTTGVEFELRRAVLTYNVETGKSHFDTGEIVLLKGASPQEMAESTLTEGRDGPNMESVSKIKTWRDFKALEALTPGMEERVKSFNPRVQAREREEIAIRDVRRAFYQGERPQEQTAGQPVWEAGQKHWPGKTKPERRYYVVGKRPLESSLKGAAYGVQVPKLPQAEHRQFIASDGSNDRGLFPKGFKRDKPTNLHLYEYYDSNKYDAVLIEAAIKEVERGMIRKFESIEKVYDTLKNNCQTYIDLVIEHAAVLSKETGIPLLVTP